MSVGGEDDNIRVLLTRIEGKQDVTNERLDTANRINDERHSTVKVHLATIDQRLHTHGNRIGNLEARNHLSDGERKGVALSTKVMWVGITALGAGLLGIAALVLKVFGA